MCKVGQWANPKVLLLTWLLVIVLPRVASTTSCSSEKGGRVLASQEDKDKASAEVDKFAAKPGDGVFTKIKRADVVKGFKDRISDPSKIYQGNSGLCPSASVVYAIARDKPLEYAKAIIDLYETGRAKIGDWTLEPCTDLKNYALTTGDTIPAVDWIPLASVRDSENWFIDYEATTDDGGAWGDEVTKWLKKAGYTKIVEEWNYFFTKGQGNLKSADEYYDKDYNVILLIDSDILAGKTGMTWKPNHWVVMASRVAYSGSGFDKKINMTVFTWGQRRELPQTGSLKLGDFLDSYYGFVACKF
jgi:hypothetical protein